jgi:FkbH-like protein
MDDLKNILLCILAQPPGMAVVHSSLARLLPPEGFGPPAVIPALAEAVNRGWTLVFPAFTFSFCHGEAFHLSSAPSESGILADWVLAALPGAVRTRHPVYSFVAAGSRAHEFMSFTPNHCFGDDSPFALFEKENALQLALGCGVDYFTQCHRYEELARVPYRYYKEFTGEADFADGTGSHIVTTRLFVLDSRLASRSDWSLIFNRIPAEKLSEIPLWRGKVLIVRTRHIKETASAMLAGDPLSLLSDAQGVRNRLERITVAGPGMKLALLGGSNLQLLRNAVERRLADLAPDFSPVLHSVPFGQLDREMALTDSDLNRFAPDVSVFCDRLEDLFSHPTLDGVDEGRLAERVRKHVELVAAWARKNGGWLILHRFAPLNASGRLTPGLFASANAILEEQLRDAPRILWLDPAAEAADIPGAAVDARLTLIGRFPYSRALSERFADIWAGWLLGIAGRGVRALALDLDDTLWKGVLGEDGVSGLQVGGDYPGNAFRDFQIALRQLHDSGIALTILSKNDSAQALAAMDTIDEMVVRSPNIAAHRIGWRPKWEGLRDIAAELNLGISSFLFIDDNPAERELMRKHLPQVKILQLPDDPVEFTNVLLRSPWLARLPATPDDLARSASYQALALARQDRALTTTPEEFFAELGSVVTIRPLRQTTLRRAEQLCHRTNQFNTTGHRYGARELAALADAGAAVAVIGLSDKYADHGNIGLIVLKPDRADAASMTIDTYLLSCRVLGRGLEIPLVHWAMRHARHLGMRRLTGKIVETDRNIPVRTAFKDAGMTPGGAPGWWTADLASVPAAPYWLAITDEFSIASPECVEAPSSRKDPVLTKAAQPPAIAEKVASVLRDQLDLSAEESVTAAALGETEGWDSLKHFSIVLALEQVLGTVFTADEMAATVSYAKLTALCTAKLRERTS